MPTAVKWFAVLCCLSPWVTLRLFHARDTSVGKGPMTRERMAERRSAEESAKTTSLVLLGVAEFGAILLLIDALRREYEAPRGWAIAIAVMGLITFGISSLVYFLIWGLDPARPAKPLGEDFCEACRAQTSDRSAPSLVMHNMLGASLLGRADRCSTCGSTVRTVWFWLLLPLVPLGAYRVLPVGKALAHKSTFISRKAPWRPAHVATVYAIVTVVVVGFIWLATR